VSELSSALKRTVEDAYGHVRVRGEISGFRGPHSSGHCYFALKDESAKIEAVIWKGVHGRMRFKPQEGLEVIATGKLTTYPGSSKYQIVIEADRARRDRRADGADGKSASASSAPRGSSKPLASVSCRAGRAASGWSPPRSGPCGATSATSCAGATRSGS